MPAVERVYYEYAGGQFCLCVSGDIETFISETELRMYVHEAYPGAELLLVDDHNWQEIYDQGGFFL